MKSIAWVARVAVVPVAGVLLLVWWTAAANDRDLGAEPMAWWAAVLLFGGFAVSAAAPRVAIGALYAAFVLQLVRVDCRFDQDGWVAYAAVILTAVVLAVRTNGGLRRRWFLGLLLPLGVLVGLFTNLPSLGIDLDHSGHLIGLVNGKSWDVRSSFAAFELVIGLVVWTVGAGLLIIAGWMAGSTYRARVLQWRAEAEAVEARAELSESRVQLRVTEERDRIAQDVHDITAHSLSVIVAQADGVAAHVEDDRTRSALTTIAGSARQALVEIRTLLEHLEQQPDGDTTHGASDIPALVESVRQAGTAVEYLEQGVPVALSAAAGLAVYRITQEALTNALRHGQTDNGPVRVVLDWRADGLALTIASPVAPDRAAAEPAGRGLVGMQQRARLAGGWLTSGIDSETASYLVTSFLPARSTATTA